MSAGDKIDSLALSIARDCSELMRLANGVANVEPPPRAVEPLLAELAAADRALSEHAERYRAERAALSAEDRALSPYANREDQRGWHLLCRRRDEAIEALSRYARAAFPATHQTLPAAANDSGVR